MFGTQISLNEGCHQLRLYSKGPNGVDPLCEGCLWGAGARHVPCASMLLRLIRAPMGPQGKPLEVRDTNTHRHIFIIAKLK